jgi:hypothetical protein
VQHSGTTASEDLRSRTIKGNTQTGLDGIQYPTFQAWRVIRPFAAAYADKEGHA